MTDFSKRVIKGYELRERIGEGGFGAVYRAFQSTVNREVAIKVVLPELANQPDFVRRFETEAQLVARLEHPHIVPLYDYWREPDGAYLIMRYLRGGSLTSALKNGPLSSEAAVRVIDQITSALAVAHRNGVIHRDIKPDNILMDEDGNAYLTDFGIAKVENIGDKTEAGVSGSPAYISPEQIRSEPTSPQTDIYGLGVVIYEMLTGKHPFPNANTSSMMIMSHLQDPLPDVSLSSELPMAVNNVIQRATSKTPASRYPDAPALGADFHQAMLNIGSPGADAIVIEIIAPDVEVTNPYKGLRAFQEADATDFFGREALITRLVQDMSEPEIIARFLAVVGPSGSGKSSVVKAGVLPALRTGILPGSDRWFFVEMFPGTQPLQELANALMRVAVNPPVDLLGQLRRDGQGLLRAVDEVLPGDPDIKLLLVIDQFEELFTQVEDEAARTHLLNSLMIALEAPNSRLRVIVTLRADFYDRPLLYAGFGEWMRKRTEVVLPLSLSELEQAITAPVQRVGVMPETELVSAILADVSEQPGALPLLQYALTELFERREGRLLTLKAYRDIDGVTGALARRADTLYDELDIAGKEAVRQLFLRLVTLGEGTEDTRRRVRRAELTTGVANAHTLDSVIDLYGKYRLLTFDRDPVTRGPTVEVAHEALIRTWMRLRGWLNDSREGLRIQRRLTAAATEWVNAGREASFLASGARLDQFEQWAAETDLVLNAEERAFLDASTATRSAQCVAEQTRKAHEEKIARRAQNFGRAAAILGVVGVLAILATVAAALTAVNAGNQSATATVSQGLAILSKQTADYDAAQAKAEVQAAGQTLTPVGPTLTAVQRALQAGNDQLATATNAQGQAQAQALAAGQTLTPVGPTLTAVQRALQAGNDRLATATIAQGQAQAQALAAGQTLTPIPPTLTAVAKQVESAQRYGNSMRYLAEANTLLRGDGGNSELGALLTIRSLQTQYSVQADSTLLQTLDRLYSYSILRAHRDAINAVAVSPDGKTIVTGSADQTAILWDVGTGKQILTFSGHTDQILGIAFSHNGKTIATASTDKTAILWDVSTGQQIRAFSGHTDVVTSVAFSPDDSQILTGSADTTAILWNAGTGNPVGKPFTGHGDRITSVAFSSDGRLVLTGSYDTTAMLWDAGSHSMIRQFTGHSNSVLSVTFAPKARMILTGSVDHTARLWNLDTGKEIRLFANHVDPVTSAVFSPDGKMIFTGSTDQTAALWDTDSGQVLRIYTGHYAGITGVAFVPNTALLLTGSIDGDARLWLTSDSPSPRLFTGHTDSVVSARFSPDGKTILTGGNDGVAWLWEAATGRPIFKIAAENVAYVSSAVFSPDGKLILTANGDGTARLWDAKTGKPIGTPIKTSSTYLYQAVFSPDGKTFATVGQDKTVRLWDVATGKPVGKPFTGHTDEIYGIDFSFDGKILVTGSKDKTARVWDVASGTELFKLSGHTATVNAVAISPDGKVIATGSDDTTIRLWDATKGTELRKLDGHTSTVWGVSFSPNGKLLLSASADKSARLWDVATGSQLREIDGHNGGVFSVAFSPDGKTFVTGSDDKTTHVWDTNYQDMIAYACTHIFNDFAPQLRQDYGIEDQNPTCQQTSTH